MHTVVANSVTFFSFSLLPIHFTIGCLFLARIWL